ncbi:hypothetical protein BBJ28_00021291 [Nothophytophthora sp. Chile5]|nr:hypothetical protein BBJ28_00021291 [Nothophytophthora sp. Chile5]
MSIDIARKEEAFVKGFYKTLLLLAREQQARSRNWDHAMKGVDEAASSLKLKGGNDLVAQAAGTTAWMENTFAERNPRCYREVITSALAETVVAGKK